MAIKITLKNSVVQDSVPTTTHLPTVGELAVNANINSIGGYMRASDNSIVKIFGPGSLSTPAATTTTAGIAELATSGETTAGTDAARVCTPAGVKAVTDAERTTSNSTYLAKAGGTLTGVLAATAGSNSAASIHFGDTDSGIYGGTNTVSLTAGGTQGLTLNSDGYVNVPTRLGVGVASPAVAFHINSGATNECARFESSDTEVTLEFKDTTGTATLKSRDDFRFGNSTGELARVDASGRLLVGLTSARTLNPSHIPPFQIEGNTATTSSISTINNINQTGGPSVWLGKSRGAALGGVVTVQSGDELGSIFFNGADGTDIASIGASIVAKSNGTVAGNRMPGELVFATTADSAGSVTPTTRLTIDNAGKVIIGTGDDIQLWHDGSTSPATSIIKNNTDNLHIRSGGNITLQNKAATETFANFADGGAVDLYFDNGLKLSTLSTGVSITGSLGIGTTTTNASDSFTIVDPGNAFMSLRSDAEADGNSQVFDFAVGTGDRASTNVVSSITSAIPSGSAAGGTLKGYLAFFTNAGDNLQERLRITSAGESIFYGSVELGDSKELRLGASQDLKLVHDGNNSYINHNGTGDFWIQAQGADENLWLRAKDDVYIQTNDSENAAKFIKNGKVELFYDGSSRLETNSEGVKIDGVLEMLDNKRIQLGTSDDLQLYSDGSDSYVLNTTDTDLIIRNTGNAGIEIANQNSFPIELKTNAETAIKCNANGSVDLYHDNSPRLITTAGGVTITGYDANDGTIIKGDLRLNKQGETATRIKWDGSDGTVGQLELFDDVKLTFGADSDLEISHDGTNNSIKSTTGHVNLYLPTGKAFSVGNSDFTEDIFRATEGGSVQLYHDNSEKLLTDANGIQVKDRITFGVSNNTVVLDFQIASTQRGYINVLETGTTYSTSSDYRLKENEVSITDGIARLKTLKPYRFNFKDIPSKIVDGFFAHEVTPVVPEAVSGEKDGEQMQGMDYGRITPLLTAALQEAIGKIEILESKVAALEGT